jgi:hypothetical protein
MTCGDRDGEGPSARRRRRSALCRHCREQALAIYVMRAAEGGAGRGECSADAEARQFGPFGVTSKTIRDIWKGRT